MIINSNTTFHRASTRQSGQALIVAVLFLVAVSTALVSVFAAPVIRDVRIARETRAGKTSYFLAEAAQEDVVYRLSKGIPVDGTETVVLLGESADVTITNNISGRRILAVGEVDNAFRSVETTILAGVGASFNYGVQTGHGGFVIGSNAGVEGNVYANGNITGSNGAFVSATAIAANSVSLVSDQSNITPATPPNTITFGNANGTQDFAQSFQVSTTSPLNKIEFYIRKTGNPGNATVRIVADANGNPGATTITSGTLVSAQVTGAFGWVPATFATNPELDIGDTYWIIIDAATNASNNYTIGANTNYANGLGKIGQHSTTWNATTPAGLDAYFTVYLGGITATIDNVDIGSGGTGNAQAHTITDSTVTGSLYCQEGSGNNKACDTSRPDPAPTAFPFTEGNITQWKQEGDDGTLISGNYHATGTTATLGPARITGNLTMAINSMLTLTGTVWVEGNISTANGSTVRVSPDYGAAGSVLITDGTVSINNNGAFQGSGTTGSYLLLITTSECPDDPSCSGDNAIDVSNNAGAVILNAQRGTLHFSNNALAKEATAYRIVMDPNAVVTYESGLTNVNFTNGPGGAFSISNWEEVE